MTTSSTPDPLPMRWAVILLAAMVIAIVAGGLTFAQTCDWPVGLLAGLGAGGTAVPVLHQVLGR